MAPGMSARHVVFLGGNGHCAARLASARAALVREGVPLSEARYPGFEGRPRAGDLDTFLQAVSDETKRPRIMSSIENSI